MIQLVWLNILNVSKLFIIVKVSYQHYLLEFRPCTPLEGLQPINPCCVVTPPPNMSGSATVYTHLGFLLGNKEFN